MIGAAIGVALLSAGLSVPDQAEAHVRWRVDGAVPPRTTDDGLSFGPCGQIPRTNTPTTLPAGAVVTLEWEETIDHSGLFIIAFSPANDAGFDQNVLLTLTDDQGPETPLPHRYSAQVILPFEPCEACTLQIVQVAMDIPDNPRYYYSCSDIRLVPDPNLPPPLPPPVVDPLPGEPSPTPPPLPGIIDPGPGGVLDLVEVAVRFVEDFALIDRNRDSVIELGEAQLAAPGLTELQFRTMDRDRSGWLELTELQNLAGGSGAGGDTSNSSDSSPRRRKGGGGSLNGWVLLVGLFGLRRNGFAGKSKKLLVDSEKSD